MLYKQKLTVLCLLFTVLLTPRLYSQTTTHPTVQGIKVSYNIQSTPDSIPMVRPQVKIDVDANTSIQKVYLKILDEAGTVIYDVNYTMTASPVKVSGLTLFSVNGQSIYINSPGIIPLDTYTYSIITEDAQGNQSAPCLKIQ